MRRGKRGQSTLEYAIIIVVVVAALIAIYRYMNRGVQGKLRESADEIGTQFSAGKTVYKVTTQQTATSQTRETYGMEGTGISNYTVQTKAATRRSATGADAETLSTKLSSEKLFDR